MFATIRAEVREALRIGVAGLAISAPTNNSESAQCPALEKDVTVLSGKVVFERLIKRVRTKVHFVFLIDVEELKRIDERRLTHIVVANDLERALKLDLGLLVIPGAD